MTPACTWMHAGGRLNMQHMHRRWQKHPLLSLSWQHTWSWWKKLCSTFQYRCTESSRLPCMRRSHAHSRQWRQLRGLPEAIAISLANLIHPKQQMWRRARTAAGRCKLALLLHTLRNAWAEAGQQQGRPAGVCKARYDAAMKPSPSKQGRHMHEEAGEEQPSASTKSRLVPWLSHCVCRFASASALPSTYYKYCICCCSPRGRSVKQKLCICAGSQLHTGLASHTLVSCCTEEHSV